MTLDRTDTPDVEADRMHELTSFQRDLLFVIAGCDNPSGLTLKAELEETTQKSILPGQLYPNLDELADADLLQKGEQDGRTNKYTLTEEGQKVLNEIYRWQTAHVSPEET